MSIFKVRDAATLLPAGTGAVLAALLAALAAGGLLLLNPVLAFAPVAVFALGFLPLRLPSIRPMTAFTYGIGLMLVSDGDYPPISTITTQLQSAFFLQHLPLTPSIFELTGFAIATVMVIRRLKAKGQSGAVDPGFRYAAATSLIFFAVLLLQALHGLATGGDFRMVYWQIHGMVQLPFWGLLGYMALETADDAVKLFDVMIAAQLLKTLQNLFLYLVMPVREFDYLSSHIASLFMATISLAIVLRMVFVRDRRRMAYYAATAALTLFVWVLNDRRTSTFGFAMSLGFGILVVSREITRRHVECLITVVLPTACYIGVTWNIGGPLGAVARAIQNALTHGNAKAEKIDYRDIENFNLFSGIAHSPVFGVGWGHPFVHYMELPDIFHFSDILSYITHNTVLLIWMNCGPFGIAALATFISTSIAASIRLFYAVRIVDLRIFAFVTFSLLIQWTLYIWADMAFTWVPSMLLPAGLSGMVIKMLRLNAQGRLTLKGEPCH